MNTQHTWLMQDPGYARAPAVCVDGEGVQWAAWISWTEEGERVRISSRPAGGEWSPPRPVTEPRPQVTGLAATGWSRGLLLAWIDGPDDELDGLKLRHVGGETDGEISLVAPLEGRPAHPAIDAGEDRYTLAFTCSMEGGRRVFAGHGRAPDPPSSTVEISASEGQHLRPAVARSGAAAVIAWELVDGAFSAMHVRRFGDGGMGDVLEVDGYDGSGVSAMAALANDGEGGVWIGWQSDVDPEKGPGLVRWIELAHLGEDNLLRRALAPMIGVERRGEGEDQGFEAPALSVLEDGRLVVVGRGSQSLRHQVLGRGGWSERVQLDEPGWQCRGRRYSACPADGGLLVAGRERDGVTLRWLPAGDADGPPELELRPPAAERETAPPLESDHRHIMAGGRVLFGDLHQHTAASDGTGTLEETFTRARYRYRDEIVAVSDHESFLGKRTPPGEWAEARRVADEHLQAGAFVTLHAAEWTARMHPGPGHKVVYNAPGDPRLYSRDDPDCATAAGLIAECRKAGALVIPHHVGWTGANLQDHDQEVQTCWEIVSCHGAYERMGDELIGTRGDDKEGQFVADALDAGLRFGLVGGSDGHGLDWHHGVCRVEDSHRSGLTGILTREVTREAVLEALRRRRCYATSGAKMGLWFEADGRPMGEELIASGPVPFRVVAALTAPLASLTLVTNGGVELELEGEGRDVDLRGTLPPPQEGGWCYYFVRLVQEDRNVAWSSPIWLDAPRTA